MSNAMRRTETPARPPGLQMALKPLARVANIERKANVALCCLNRHCKAGQTSGASARTSDDFGASSLKANIERRRTNEVGRLVNRVSTGLLSGLHGRPHTRRGGAFGGVGEDICNQDGRGYEWIWKQECPRNAAKAAVTP